MILKIQKFCEKRELRLKKFLIFNSKPFFINIIQSCCKTIKDAFTL